VSRARVATRWWPRAALLLALGAVAMLPAPVQGQDTGTIAPDFSASLLADSAEAPWQFWARAETPVTILSFWASWCKPCDTLHPWLEALADRYHDRGVQVVAINMREPADSIRRLLAGDSASATVNLLDSDGHVVLLYSVTSVPTTILVSSSNVVLRRWEGVKSTMSGVEPVLERTLTAAPVPTARGAGP
jgi:thiol-disulfide isomerase/thioredoxin